MLLPTCSAFLPIFLLLNLGVHEVVNKINENDHSSTYYSSCEETDDHCLQLAEYERISLVLIGQVEQCSGIFKLTPMAEPSMNRFEWKKDMLYDMTRNKSLLPDEMVYYYEKQKFFLTSGSSHTSQSSLSTLNKTLNGTCSLQESNKEIEFEYSENIMATAINWVDGNIYYSNGIKIFAFKYDPAAPHLVKTLINNVTIQPRSLSIDPLSGWIFWINNDQSGIMIEKAGLDGSNRTSIVPVQISSKNTTQLCVDLNKTQLYWLQSNGIWTCDYNGKNWKFLTSLISDSPYESTVKAMIYFNDWIYWINGTENGSDTIHATNIRLSKHHQIKSTSNESSRFRDIKVYQRLTQPKGLHYCKDKLFNCSYLCLRSPAYSFNFIKYRCYCPDGFTWGDDNLTCQNYSTLPESQPLFGFGGGRRKPKPRPFPGGGKGPWGRIKGKLSGIMGNLMGFLTGAMSFLSGLLSKLFSTIMLLLPIIGAAIFAVFRFIIFAIKAIKKK